MSEIVMIGDQEVSLADLAGVDMTGVSEFRFSVTPVGVYNFRGVLAELRPIDTQDGKKVAVVFTAEIIGVLQTEDADADALIGRKHDESFFLSDLAKGLGSVKAFMADAGMNGNGPLNELLLNFTGHEFGAQVKHRKDKNDPDKVYAGLRKVKSAAQMAELAAA